jgi:hypothetical protein
VSAGVGRHLARREIGREASLEESDRWLADLTEGACLGPGVRAAYEQALTTARGAPAQGLAEREARLDVELSHRVIVAVDLETRELERALALEPGDEAPVGVEAQDVFDPGRRAHEGASIPEPIALLEDQDGAALAAGWPHEDPAEWVEPRPPHRVDLQDLEAQARVAGHGDPEGVEDEAEAVGVDDLPVDLFAGGQAKPRVTGLPAAPAPEDANGVEGLATVDAAEEKASRDRHEPLFVDLENPVGRLSEGTDGRVLRIGDLGRVVATLEDGREAEATIPGADCARDDRQVGLSAPGDCAGDDPVLRVEEDDLARREARGRARETGVPVVGLTPPGGAAVVGHIEARRARAEADPDLSRKGRPVDLLHRRDRTTRHG